MEKKNKGFTLIELLVVIAIIGILSSVVLASLNTARQKARDARRVSDIKQIQLALELYADDNSGNYPGDIYAASGSLAPNYMAKIPTDPLNQTNYLFASKNNEYHLGATLENAANVPSNDANCDSNDNTPGNCFSAVPLNNTGSVPFDGSVAKVYDQKN